MKKSIQQFFGSFQPYAIRQYLRLLIFVNRLSMKSRENNRNKNSQQKNKSVSYDRCHKKSNFSSMIFQSGRNSLCSPKQAKIPNGDKYQTYMQFISTGKLVMDFAPQKTNIFINKRNSITPVPRRMSNSLTDQGRRSVTGKQNSCSKFIGRNGSFSKNQTPRQSINKNKPLFVKGNNIAKVQQQNKNRKESKNKQSRPISANKKKGKGPKSNKTNQKQDEREKKLLEKLFNGIEFHRDLGKGAHALVKSGVDWNNKRKIAIKIYDKKSLKNDELKSIQNEVQILGSLDNPKIIKLYQIMQSYKTINLIMEYGGGNSVEQYLKNKKKGYLDENQAKQIFKQALEGIAYLHENKIAHRDIKTSNILLNKYLKVKIIDFGFSLKVQPGEIISQYCGTPTYMPPQVVTKTPHNPFFADVWSLGILLYTMLNGHCPFKASNQKQLFAKICEGKYDYQTHLSKQSIVFNQLFLKQNPQDRITVHEAIRHPWLMV